VLIRDDEILQEVTGGSPERGTNNIAEFKAILCGLGAAQAWLVKDESVTVISDSTLCIGYLSGGWRSNNAALGRLRLQIRKVEKALDAPVIYKKGSIDDELFQLADVLAKEAVPQGYKEKETDE